jgi:hypothetical protein
MHTHSFWSDGDEFPELVAEWYKKRGYNFVVFTPHNSRMRRDDEKWLNVETKPGVAARLPQLRRRFGEEWIRDRVYQGRTQVRVTPLAEFRSHLEEPNRFLLIAGEEITDTGGEGNLPVHLNVMNLQETILPQGGGTVREVLKRNVEAALAQKKRTGKPLLIQVNHPNYEWAIRADDIADTRGVRFFEVFNGHPHVNNRGDATHPSTDRIWDLVLARRYERGNREPLYGLAVDDAHKFNTPHGIGAKPGRGWVMVRDRTGTGHLRPEILIKAMERGDFYSSSGVRLEDVRWTGRQLSLKIDPVPGARYKTRFIGTRKNATSSEIGVVLDEVEGTSPSYTVRGDERYVRAKVISNRVRPDVLQGRRVEQAWTQPVFLK